MASPRKNVPIPPSVPPAPFMSAWSIATSGRRQEGGGGFEPAHHPLLPDGAERQEERGTDRAARGRRARRVDQDPGLDADLLRISPQGLLGGGRVERREGGQAAGQLGEPLTEPRLLAQVLVCRVGVDVERIVEVGASRVREIQE